MIQLRLLGTIQLQSDDGRDVRAVLAQPRRLALLAWLALHGTTRRETLLGVFSPESETDRARSALRNALHFLRRELGSEAIESIGDGELRVGPDRVWCDARAFEERLEEGRAEEALELYRGDLLEGFHVDGAPEFERWVDDERRRLHRRALEALSNLVNEAVEAGQPALAVHHARHALTLEPVDEPIARRLVTLLWRAGERTAAIRTYDEFAERLAAEYDLEPTEETAALVRTLRAEEAREARRTARTDAAERDADGEAAASPGGPDPGPPPAGSDGAPIGAEEKPADPSIGRRARAGAAMAALAILAVVVAWIVGRGPDPPPVGSPDVLAIMPFSYRGSPELSYLGEGMVTLLGATLDGAGALRVVETRDILERVPGGSPEDVETARAVARRLGAGTFMVGEVIETGGRISVRAAVHRAGSRDPELPDIHLEGSAEDLPSLVDELGATLLESRAGSGFARVAVRTTGSLEALKHFLVGDVAYRAGRHREAVGALRRAVRIDPSFALAHYRLSTAAIWVEREELARQSAARAVEHSGRLSVEDSLLVLAWFHHRQGRVELAEPLYRRVIELEPDGVEPWSQLAELIFHWRPLAGGSMAESREAFERVLAVDPDHANALVHLARVAAVERREGDLRRWTRRLETLDPDSWGAHEARLLRDVVFGVPTERRAAIRRAAGSPGTLEAAQLAVAVYAQDVDAAIELAREMTGTERSERQRIRGRLLWADLEAARGRWRSARQVLDEPGGMPVPRALEFGARMATLPFLPVEDEELRRLAESLRDPALTPAPPPADHPMWHGAGGFPPLVWEGIHAPRRDYLRGALAARRGDAAGVAEATRGLERLDRPLSPYYVRLVRATGAWARRDPSATLRELGPPRAWSTFESVTDYPRAQERFLRAEALAAEGRWAEALRWYDTFPSASGHDLAYLAPAQLGRARAYVALGDRERGRRAYQRFLSLWSGADRELQPIVERARAELGRLPR